MLLVLLEFRGFEVGVCMVGMGVCVLFDWFLLWCFVFYCVCLLRYDTL